MNMFSLMSFFEKQASKYTCNFCGVDIKNPNRSETIADTDGRFWHNYQCYKADWQGSAPPRVEPNNEHMEYK